jgi:hypothetical protein
MAQSLTSKQVNFAGRYCQAIGSLINAIDGLTLLKAEWDANAYATGASPVGNNLTDALLQGNGYAYLTALQVNSAVGAVETIRTTVAANRGYLEALRS